MRNRKSASLAFPSTLPSSLWIPTPSIAPSSKQMVFLWIHSSHQCLQMHWRHRCGSKGMHSRWWHEHGSQIGLGPSTVLPQGAFWHSNKGMWHPQPMLHLDPLSATLCKGWALCKVPLPSMSNLFSLSIITRPLPLPNWLQNETIVPAHSSSSICLCFALLWSQAELHTASSLTSDGTSPIAFIMTSPMVDGSPTPSGPLVELKHSVLYEGSKEKSQRV